MPKQHLQLLAFAAVDHPYDTTVTVFPDGHVRRGYSAGVTRATPVRNAAPNSYLMGARIEVMNLIARTGQIDIDSNKGKSALVNFPVRATELALHETNKSGAAQRLTLPRGHEKKVRHPEAFQA